jgi:hypothetical protein
MSQATNGLRPGFRPPQDTLAGLLRDLDRHTRIARRRGAYDLVHSLRQATRLLRVMALDEQEALR